MGGGGRKDIFYLDREGEIREKLVFLINNLAQTGKILLHSLTFFCKRNGFQGKLWRM